MRESVHLSYLIRTRSVIWILFMWHDICQGGTNGKRRGGGVGMGGKCKRMNASMGKHTIGAVRAACWVPAYSGCA